MVDGGESEWTADEPSSGAEERGFQALLGGARPPSSARAAQGRMQLRARPLQRPASEEPSSHEQQSSEDGEELGAQAGHGQDDTRAAAAKYLGVCYAAHWVANPYHARIQWQRQRYNLGSFLNAVSAAKAYDWAARLVGDKRKLNFGREVDMGMPQSTEGAASLRARVSQVGGTAALERAAEARYHGIYRCLRASAKPFEAQFRWRGIRYCLGVFADALSASRAYDWAARLIGEGRLLIFDASDDLGAPPTAPGAARLRKDVAAAAAQVTRPLGPGAAPRGVSSSPALAPTVASAALPAPPQQRPAAGAAAKRPARAAHSPGPPPAARKRRAPPQLQPAPRGAGEPLRADSSLVSQLRMLLRLRGLREDDLVLDQLGEGTLRDITADVRRAGSAGGISSQCAEASLGGHSALDLQARLTVNMRLRDISEDGVRLDLPTGEVGRGLLLHVLSVRGQSGGSD